MSKPKPMTNEYSIAINSPINKDLLYCQKPVIFFPFKYGKNALRNKKQTKRTGTSNPDSKRCKEKRKGRKGREN